MEALLQRGAVEAALPRGGIGGAKLAAVQRQRGEMELVALWHGARRGRENPAEV
jgi:hypothetical protein